MKTKRRGPSLIALRALAAAVTLLLLGGQALGTIHQLVVPHQLCAEHGHLVHAEQPAAAAPSRNTQGPLVRSDARESDEHAHCALAVRRDELRSLIPSSNAACLAAAPSAASSFACVGIEPCAGPPLLLLAPKQSPPA